MVANNKGINGKTCPHNQPAQNHRSYHLNRQLDAWDLEDAPVEGEEGQLCWRKSEAVKQIGDPEAQEKFLVYLGELVIDRLDVQAIPILGH